MGWTPLLERVLLGALGVLGFRESEWIEIEKGWDGWDDMQ